RGEPSTGLGPQLLEGSLDPRVARVALELHPDQSKAVRIEPAHGGGDDARGTLAGVRVGDAAWPLDLAPIRLPGRKAIGDGGDRAGIGGGELAAIGALDQHRRRRGALDLAEGVA